MTIACSPLSSEAVDARVLVLRMYLQLFLVVLTFFVVKFIVDHIRRERYLKSFIKPPGRGIFQHYYVFRDKNDMLPKMTNLMNTYGTLLRINLGPVPALFITDKEFLKVLLGTSTIMNKDDTYEKIESWLGSGLLTSKKEKWVKTRKILTPAFHLQVLENYSKNFQHSISTLIKKLDHFVDKNPFDVYPLLTLCTLDIICETAMGTEINAQCSEQSEYVKSVKEMLRIVQDRSQSIWKHFQFLYIFSNDFWKEKRALKILHKFTKDVINQKKSRKDSSSYITNKKDKLSFIDLLLEAKDNNKWMTDEDIAHEVDTFMFAGHDTTASATSFALYCLSRNKKVQDLVIKEIAGIFGEDNRSPTFQDLQQMQYLNLVIKESLRLYPPVPIFVRSSESDIKLGKWTMPKDISIAIFAYGLHRNPIYFPNPEQFIPERFENEVEPYTYLPFSSGSRNCIGQKFAVLEMKAIISTILRSYEILPVENYKPIPVTNVVLGSANGVQIKLTKRYK